MAATELIPDFDWLAETCDVDDSWVGPGPMLVNLKPWIERLAAVNHPTMVAASYAAARKALPHWDTWLAESPDIARESILDGQPPSDQLTTVAVWLNSPTDGNSSKTIETVDLTKQLHWYHEEYQDVWFNEPGMWAVESAEHCVLSLTGDPYSNMSLTHLATITVWCAVNSFRSSGDEAIRDPLRTIVDAIAEQLANAG